MQRFWLITTTYLALGWGNLFRVLGYRIKIKSGFFKRTLPIGEPVLGPFFNVPPKSSENSPLANNHSDNSTLLLFGWMQFETQNPPNWHQSVLTNKIQKDASLHWTEISDFNSSVGDIKGVWELSRFSWLLDFSLKYRKTNNPIWLNKSNQWIEDWSMHNPVNQGANWKCAQEASIRVMHLAAAALVLEKLMPSAAMAKLIKAHLKRITPTLNYAKAQDNNHGTSEGAALFIGGSWLLLANPNDSEAKRWQKVGRAYLHERAARLIAADGTFSQYSVTYHRLMLDALSFVELWRKQLKLASFSESYLNSLSAATHWLLSFIDNVSGDAPNLGANDGAFILNLSGAAYRDFRPSAELASQLFLKQSAFSTKQCKRVRELFGLAATKPFMWPASQQFSAGGYALLRAQSTTTLCVLNVPSYTFRPSQADMLHIDLWVKGVNLLRDAGSYSYNSQAKWLAYFNGIQGHNSVQFDGRQPMPKVSRFLYGKWPQYQTFKVQEQSAYAEYIDCHNAGHHRDIQLLENQLIVTDRLFGDFSSACLRWRLADLPWQLVAQTLSAQNIQISVVSSESLISFNLAEGYESLYYGQKNRISVLEITVDKSTRITTTISWL